MSDEIDAKKKRLIDEIRRCQQSDFIYGKFLEDYNEHLIRFIEDQKSSVPEQSFIQSTGDKIKEKLSTKLQSIDYDLEYINDELDTIINILNEIKDANHLMEN